MVTANQDMTVITQRGCCLEARVFDLFWLHGMLHRPKAVDTLQLFMLKSESYQRQ